jgi:hypothetical protein
VLGWATKEELEFATDGIWPEDADDYAAMEARVAQAMRTRDNWKADCLTHEEIARLAGMAISLHAPGRWPRTLEETDNVMSALLRTRDLLVLRDTLGGKPSQEELDEPE